ncbi:DUF2750 domain-containing protein [Sporolactobacillus shoreicorticis]|uniref:DUF2750 domain-containing protein n=1 Tax=Sporolactobacillus shoreicorticis TaxID=1923877 RepID=A0ABW5S2D3_9BACL|nr:DUF2750 domain-containing protein [Sporolactobacillus shoreicorticis]MCO7127607.1 DUF2750 domain-containing protein [Sporolactobacillus shoreicorticis]
MGVRTGLRIRSEKGVHAKVRDSCINFAVWLRLNRDFPIRVVVYLKKSVQIKTVVSKELVSATFFAPYDKNSEPYIRVATGDYDELVRNSGEAHAINAILTSMAHELVHYQQWIEDRNFDESEAEHEASKLADDYCEGSTFFEEAVHQNKVWTIANEEGYSIATNEQGESVVPFWSSQMKIDKAINSVPAYRSDHSLEVPLNEFTSDWINELKEDDFLVGINWCGRGLMGHELLPNKVLERIQDEIKAKNERIKY